MSSNCKYSFLSTTRTEQPLLTGKWNKVFFSAGHEVASLSELRSTENTGKSFSEIATGQKFSNYIPNNVAPVSIRLLITLRIHPFKLIVVPVYQLPQWRSKRISPPVKLRIMIF